MVSRIGEFECEGMNIIWINAISKVGYVLIESKKEDNSDFEKLWTLGDKIGQFLRTNVDPKADAVCLHYFELPNRNSANAIIPRYSNDFEDNNIVYTISESDTQKETSTIEIISPLVDQLKNYLK